MVNINQIEHILGILQENNWGVTGQNIAKSHFNHASLDMLRSLSSTEYTTRPDWNDFKSDFIKNQEYVGIYWETIPGKGGPLSLSKIKPPIDIGLEMGEIELRKGTTKGNLDDKIREILPNLQKIRDASSDIVDISDLREGFKAAEAKNKAFTFLPGRANTEFERSIKTYRYEPSETGKNEFELGEKAKEKIKELLSLSVLSHTQTSHSKRKLENADLVGFSITQRMDGDSFSLYSFELKATNDIGAISQAISQAVNYKSWSNYTYIVAPQIDSESFHDKKRLDDLLNICKGNGVGAISIAVDTKNHKIRDAVKILEAERIERGSDEWLKELTNESGHEVCPLCRGIVVKYERTHCRWNIPTDDSTSCMKELLEKKISE